MNFKSKGLIRKTEFGRPKLLPNKNGKMTYAVQAGKYALVGQKGKDKVISYIDYHPV